MKHPQMQVDDRFYIYLEYVYPGSINKYVQEHCGAITESVVRNFTRHILQGLAYLHSKRTMHRFRPALFQSCLDLPLEALAYYEFILC